jgi:hypothetical protein
VASHELVVRTGGYEKDTLIYVVPKINVLTKEDEAIAEPLIAGIKKLKRLGKKIVVDYTDDYLSDFTRTDSSIYRSELLYRHTSLTRRYYEELIQLADLITVSSGSLLDSVGKYTNCPVFLIPDAIDKYESIPLQGEKITTWEGLWFGMPKNIPDLIDAVYYIDKLVHEDLVLTCLTSPQWIRLQDASLFQSGLRRLQISWHVWDYNNFPLFANRADFFLIPNESHKYASNNRLITAFQFDKLVIASDIPSYLPYKNYYLSLKSEAGTRYFQGRTHDSISLNSSRISKDYETRYLANLWANAFLSLIDR